MVSLTDISASLAYAWAENTCIQIDIDKMYTYLDILVTYNVSFTIVPFTMKDILENIKWGMALSNDLSKDIWSYYELLFINPIVLMII